MDLEPSGTRLGDEPALELAAPSAAPAASAPFSTLVTERAELPAGYPPMGASSAKARQDSLAI